MGDFEKDFLHLNVFDSKTGEKLTTCYSPEAGRSGWCATCRINAPDTDPNACANAKVKDKVFASASPDRDWGICKQNCVEKSPSTLVADTLNEVELSIFNGETCAKVLKKSNSSYDVTKEICAGRINRRSTTHAFKFIFSRLKISEITASGLYRTCSSGKMKMESCRSTVTEQWHPQPKLSSEEKTLVWEIAAAPCGKCLERNPPEPSSSEL